MQRTEPAGGPEAGGTHVWVRGANLHYGRASKYRCRFGDPLGYTWSTIVTGTYEPTISAIRCISPRVGLDNGSRPLVVLPNITTEAS